MKIVNISKKREKIVKRVYFLKIGTGTGCCTLRMYDEGTCLVERALLGTCRIPVGVYFQTPDSILGNLVYLRTEPDLGGGYCPGPVSLVPRAMRYFPEKKI